VQKVDEESKRITALRDQLEKNLTQLNVIKINGNTAHRLPNVTNLSFAGIPGDRLLTEISRTIAVSSGSACTSANPEPSHVLKAMGVTDDLAKSSIRFGLGRFTTQEEIEYAIDKVKKNAANL
jgi:cysteine desulfurase